MKGTSDPVVYVEAFGQKYATEVKESCLSCVFDETFVFGLRNLDKDVFEEGVIRYLVYAVGNLIEKHIHFSCMNKDILLYSEEGDID